MASKEYTDQSISSLKGADRVRKRPAVIFGSEGLEGCEHSFFEILSNSIDEAREGYGKEITVTVHKDGVIEVDDHGRGVPLDFNKKEGRYNWELVYCELYAGGKYENNKKGAYKYSLGLNGLGACATQYSSEFMDVYSYKNNTMYEIHFKKGEPCSELISRELERGEKRTGTLTRWRPDLDVFTDTDIPREYYRDILHKQAVVNAGLKLILKYQLSNGKFETEEFIYKNGISDYINEITDGKSLTEPVLWDMSARGRDREDKDEYELEAQISFCVSNTVSMLEYYHNSSFLEHGGSPDKAVRRAFTFELDKYLRANNKYLKNEAKITFTDIQDCLVLVINSFSTQTSYENQTKKSITNKFIEDALCDFMREKLEIYFQEHGTETELFANQVLVNKRSREKAETTRLDLKKKLATSNDITSRVEKFVSCRSKDPEKRELYIVEGDSALSSCKLGRDAEFQAIIPVRGKTLNCLKCTYDKIFKSDIIVDLLKVIGCGVEVRTKSKDDMAPFDINALKWHKIIICTDADEDGFQIRTLILTMFYRLLPSLIKEGRIYIAESPLYEITTSKEKIYFAYNENEKAEILEKIGNEKYTIQRSKGLGENEADMMWQTTMNPETRRLIQVNPADEYETQKIFETLLGDDIPARKAFIAENSARYMDLADI